MVFGLHVKKDANAQLIHSLFEEPIASTIISAPFILDDDRDILCWDLTPNGKCNFKITYKLCMYKIQDLHVNQPSRSPPCYKTLFCGFGRKKYMAPWFKHLLGGCWGNHFLLEQEQARTPGAVLRKMRYTVRWVHLFQGCLICTPLVHQSWLTFFFLLLRPLYLLLIIWYFNGFFIAFRIQEHISIPTIIYCLLSTKHRHASIPNIFTSLWSMWKAGNDVVLCTKHSMPPHVHQARKIYLTTNLCRFLLNL